MNYSDLDSGQFFHMVDLDNGRKLYKSVSPLVAIDCETGREVKLASISANGEVEPAHIGGIKKLTVMFELNAEELSERASSLATAELSANEHRRQEEYHKDMAKTEKTFAEKWESQREKLANAYKYRKEERPATPCPEVFDYEELTATAIHPTNGEILATRLLEDDECTPPLIEVEAKKEEVIDPCTTCGEVECICPTETIEFEEVIEEEEPEPAYDREEEPEGQEVESILLEEDELF
jgi:ferredoxin